MDLVRFIDPPEESILLAFMAMKIRVRLWRQCVS
jgi:hypothetical protein